MAWNTLWKLSLEDRREYNRFYSLACPEVRLASERKNRVKRNSYARKWAKSHLEYFRLRNKKRREDNPEKIRGYDRKRQAVKTVYAREKRRDDVCFRIASIHRSRINAALQGKNKLMSSKELLGCSFEDFKIYLESKWEPGMSWDNHGRTGWHIDHIMPCAIFDLTKPEHQKRCFHFSNMQPLWATANLSKNKKLCTHG